MSQQTARERIEKCSFLLAAQKKKVLEMLEDDDPSLEREEVSRKLIDDVLRGLLSITIDDLTPDEEKQVNWTIADNKK